MRFRYWVLVSSGLFIIGIVAGVLFSNDISAGISALFYEQASTLEELVTGLEPYQPITAIFIYIKNAAAVVFSFLFSPFLCILPVIALLFNSAFLSYFSVMVVQEKSLGFLLAGILPHGILEIPALIIGEAAAISFGVSLIIALVTADRNKMLLPRFKTNLKYLLIALALLVPAAIIETFVTPLLLS
jgi:stage II sporulation protein M